MTEQDPNRDELIRGYLKSRSDVSAPADLIDRALVSQPTRRFGANFGFAGLAAAVGSAFVLGLVVILGSGVLLAPGPTETTASTVSTSQPSGTGPQTPAPSGPFPGSVAGMPVLSVGQALDLLHSGGLNGRVVAVAGYFAEVQPPCPYPGRQLGPLENWCRIAAFTDVEADARMCTPNGSNGELCSAPSGPSLAPFFMSETSGVEATQPFSQRDPIPLVVIGHAGDPRQWQCMVDKQSGCASAFVVDRIAWASGQDVPVTAPQTGHQISGAIISPRMTLDGVVAALHPAGEVLTGAAFDAGDTATVDPRFNLAGDALVWVVRSLQPSGDAAGPTRGVTVSLVDDASGAVLGTNDLAMAADYQPARLWIQAVAPFECCPGDQPFPFFSVMSGSQTLHEGIVDGTASGAGRLTQYAPRTPVVLDAGEYNVTAWLSALPLQGAGPSPSPSKPCLAEVVLRPALDAHLQATFAKDESCSWDIAPDPTPTP